MMYEVVSLDVWGNRRDGYEVNDAYSTGVYININEDTSDADIIKLLKAAGFLKKTCKNKSFSVNGEFGYSLHITHEPTDYPVYDLKCVGSE